MDQNWQPPDEWTKAGLRFSAISALRTQAWTRVFTAKMEGGSAGGPPGRDVIIKVFNVPVDIVQDPQRITTERDKFLISSRLQKKMSDAGAKGWVKTYAVSEEGAALVMDKCGPTLQGFIDNRAHVSANDLYCIVLSVIDALDALFSREQRSHGSLNASDVLAAGGGAGGGYLLEDPAPEGDKHSANDLYCLGEILYQLIEHKEYDPLVPLQSTASWDRFGARRDRWIQFCTMLLNPNGWHEALPRVKKEALRLKPVSRLRAVGVAVAGIAIIAGAAVAVDRYVGTNGKTIVAEPTTGTATTIHADAKAELNSARQTYQDLREKFSALVTGSHYDHTKSRQLFRKSRDMVPDPTMIVDDAACRSAAADYRKATEALQAAMDAANVEEAAGQAQDKTDAGKKQTFTEARARWQQQSEQWNAAVKGAVGTKADLTEAKKLADEAHAALPEQVVLTDTASYEAAAKSYEDATEKLRRAIAAAERAKREHPNVDPATAIAKGNEALKQQKYDDALKWYEAAADAGNAAAMNSVGLLYETGKAGPKDDAQAMEWYRKAAEKNYLPAVVNLAAEYDRDQNYGKAFVYYKQAAEAGDVASMVRLGNLYEGGLGTAENTAEAVHWYQKAAEMNNSTAMTDLGVLYERGYGVKLDDAEALRWYQKAAALNNPAAMNAIGGLYDAGHGVKQDPTEAMKWYKKAADLNFAPAMTNIGAMYDNGQGVPRDSAIAMTWFRKAADLGDGMGMFNVGVLYEMGRGTSQNIAEALTWYRRAVKANDPNARQSALDRIGRLGFPP